MYFSAGISEIAFCIRGALFALLGHSLFQLHHLLTGIFILGHSLLQLDHLLIGIHVQVYLCRLHLAPSTDWHICADYITTHITLFQAHSQGGFKGLD